MQKLSTPGSRASAHSVQAAEWVYTLLTQGMGPDLHWFPMDVSPQRLAMTLVGMANAGGGTVLLGISPRSGHVSGVDDPHEAIDRVFQAGLLAEPTLVLPVPQVIDLEQAKVVAILVPQGLPNVYSVDGRYLGREGTQSNPLSARRLRQLLHERGVMHFETRLPPGATFDDLDNDLVKAYSDRLQMPGSEAPDQVLARRGCLILERGIFRPTYAALLLFGRYPQQWLPNASILAARFSGNTFSDRFIKQEISGTLAEQLQKAEIFIRENLRSHVHISGMAHEEQQEYPPEAVRELLVNAVAHRDYNLQGDNIHLNIFADRIEVQSPGGLPGPVTLANLLEGAFSRNAVIVQVLADIGYVERLGYGLDRVVELADQFGLRAPRFEEVAGTFRVTLAAPEYNEPGGMDLPEAIGQRLNPRQRLAIAYLTRHARITNHEYQALCPDVHAETLRRDMADLAAKGILIKIGDKRATYDT